MENIRKSLYFVELNDDAKRQFIDANATFHAWEAARKAALEVRGGMYWKRTDKVDYLIRTSRSNSQKSLGARSPETEAMFERFTVRKATVEQREAALRESMVRHRKMNRALGVGRTPNLVVDILNMLSSANIAEHFTVVGTHALYAYETAAGVLIADSAALQTRDVDLLWDTRNRIQFVTQMKIQDSSMVGLLQKVDPTFAIRQDQRYTATNSKGFEVDIIRREVAEDDPHPVRLSDDEDDFWVAQAKNAGTLVSAPRFSSMIVSTIGVMARMNTISPVVFCKFKRWLAQQPDRDPLKRSRDQRQAELVEALIDEYLPQWAPAAVAGERVEIRCDEGSLGFLESLGIVGMEAYNPERGSVKATVSPQAMSALEAHPADFAVVREIPLKETTAPPRAAVRGLEPQP